jgi:hypothetical protein
VDIADQPQRNSAHSDDFCKHPSASLNTCTNVFWNAGALDPKTTVVTFPALAHTTHAHTPRRLCEEARKACREVKTSNFSFTFFKIDRFKCLDITLSESATIQPRLEPSHKSCAESITGEAVNIPRTVALKQTLLGIPVF